MNKPVQLELNEVVGGYRLDAMIGQGGMGSVFSGTHARLGRRAAVKILANNLASDEEYVSRFFHEARIVNEIGHPNIIDIIDFVETTEPRCVAYIMELIEGPSLGSILKQRPLSVRQATNAAIQLTSALRAVHDLSVVHRDMKPDNVLVIGPLESDLGAVPSIKVLDFGIAKIQDSGAQHKTSTGMILGTPAYMAPEQVAAEPVSAATDVYAIGEILYEMLSGRRVFSGDNMTLLRAKLMGDIPALTYPEGLPCKESFDALIKTMLVQAPTKRPSTEQVENSLTEILAMLPPGPEPPMKKRSRSTSTTGRSYTGQGAPSLAMKVNDTKASAKPTSEPTPLHYAPSVAMLAPPKEAAPKSNRSILIGGAGFLALSLVATGIWYRSHQDSEVIEEAVVSQETPAIKEAKPVEVLPQPKAFAVQVQSTPAGAEVVSTDTGTVLGQTPLSVEIAVGKDRRVLELKLAGHQTQSVELRRGEAKAEVSLVASAAPIDAARPATKRTRRAEQAESTSEQAPAQPTVTPPRKSGPLKKSELGSW